MIINLTKSKAYSILCLDIYIDVSFNQINLSVSMLSIYLSLRSCVVDILTGLLSQNGPALDAGIKCSRTTVCRQPWNHLHHQTPIRSRVCGSHGFDSSEWIGTEVRRLWGAPWRGPSRALCYATRSGAAGGGCS